MPQRRQSRRPRLLKPPAVVESAGDFSEGTARWLLARAGCLGLLILCGLTLFLMDAFASDILYAPLRTLGFIP